MSQHSEDRMFEVQYQLPSIVARIAVRTKSCPQPMEHSLARIKVHITQQEMFKYSSINTALMHATPRTKSLFLTN
jgi:hypothetical protein